MNTDPMERDVDKLQEIIRNERMEIDSIKADKEYQGQLLAKATDKVMELNARLDRAEKALKWIADNTDADMTNATDEARRYFEEKGETK